MKGTSVWAAAFLLLCLSLSLSEAFKLGSSDDVTSDLASNPDSEHNVNKRFAFTIIPGIISGIGNLADEITGAMLNALAKSPAKVVSILETSNTMTSENENQYRIQNTEFRKLF